MQDTPEAHAHFGWFKRRRHLKVDEITVVDKPMLKRAVGAAALGNAMEWFDFGVYGYLAVTMTSVFTEGMDRQMGLLVTLLGFAVSFALRPLGERWALLDKVSFRLEDAREQVGRGAVDRLEQPRRAGRDVRVGVDLPVRVVQRHADRLAAVLEREDLLDAGEGGQGGGAVGPGGEPFRGDAVPSGAADDRDRPLGGGEQVGESGHRLGKRALGGKV